MKNINSFALILSCAITTLNAQTVDDALRYSQLQVIGTARNAAMGGAFGALGGDFSVSSINPAGLAVYRSSEFSVTPSVFGSNASALYNGIRMDDSRINMNFSNVGFVSANVFNESGGGWVSTSFAAGYNRTNNFHRNIAISGTNYTSSLLDVFIRQANSGGGLPPDDLDPFGALLAFQTNLIFDVDTMNDSYLYTSDIPGGGENGVTQKNSIGTSGGTGETVFSFAGNYDDRLYLGATIGYSTIRYNFFSSYREDAIEDTIIDSFTYNNEFITRGGGFNLKIGFLYRVMDWFRLGGAVHTPTFYSLTDNYGSTMTSRFQPGYTSYDATESNTGNFNYKLQTPMRAIGSMAFVIGKKGLISADYEYVDYSSARFSSSSQDFGMNENISIRETLTAVSNIRVGAEWKFDPFSIRGGYSLQSNPYRNNINEGSINSYSIGFGIREQALSLDFAYVLSQMTNHKYYIYDPSLVNPALINFNTHAILATLGYRF